MDVSLHIAQDPEADALLSRSPLAALTGMLLDQQVPMEWAFSGPYTIARRMGADDLDAHANPGPIPRHSSGPLARADQHANRAGRVVSSPRRYGVRG